MKEFIDAPVKTYSSGMYVRLGFAVAIHVDPDVLLVDEVLAVGDEGFTHKCLDKFAEFKRRGKTILLVTHSLGLVERFCDEALWLDRGRIKGSGRSEAHRRRLHHRRREARRAGAGGG
jgi:ABC-type polysaccharide/polyol phosphate transport system ATPase subunit